MRRRLLALASIAAILFAPVTAWAQAVGSPGSLDFATWNIEWFGSTSNGPSNEALQFENVATIMERSDIDLWALQEISSASVFSALVDRLGAPWVGEMAPYSQTQKTAFVWRSDVLRKRSSQLILTDFAASFGGRPPFRLEATVDLPDTSFVVVFVNVHMKAFDDVGSYEQRAEASLRLKNRFDFSESSANLVLVGDLNDELGASITIGRMSPYANFVDDGARYRFLTGRLDAEGVCTYCGSTPSTIDHILVSDELFRLADRGVTDRLSSVVEGNPLYIANTSDHFPVFATLVPTAPATATERHEIPTEPAVFPIPARDRLTVRRTGLGPGMRLVELVDALGRRVAAVADAGDSAEFSLTDLPPGLYVVRVDGRPVRLVPVL